MTVDLNADVGEGCANDAALFEIVTSANIACGWHAGDEETMRRTVRAAMTHGIAIGAHPSYPDRERFGRAPMNRATEDVYADVAAQLRSLHAVVAKEGGALRHVKAHGALYNAASADRIIADAIVAAVRDFDPALAVVGLAGGALIDAATRAGMRAVPEGFADRRYDGAGMLVPRTAPGAFVENADEALEQTLALIGQKVQSICLHGDDPHALEFAKTLRDGLKNYGISIAAVR